MGTRATDMHSPAQTTRHIGRAAAPRVFADTYKEAPMWRTWDVLKDRPLVWMPDQKEALDALKRGVDHMLAKAQEETDHAEAIASRARSECEQNRHARALAENKARLAIQETEGV